MEEITTRDESSHIAAQGQRVLPNGGISADGPPTTLSGTGVDRMVFAQANITRDNTKFVNGAVVGDRNVFQVSLLVISAVLFSLLVCAFFPSILLLIMLWYLMSMSSLI